MKLSYILEQHGSVIHACCKSCKMPVRGEDFGPDGFRCSHVKSVSPKAVQLLALPSPEGWIGEVDRAAALKKLIVLCDCECFNLYFKDGVILECRDPDGNIARNLLGPLLNMPDETAALPQPVGKERG